MLNITRRRGERIIVGEDIFVSVLEVSGQTVRLGIDAPRSVRVYREELWLEIKAQNEAAVQAAAQSALPEGAIPELGGAPDAQTPPSREGGDAATGPDPSAPAQAPVNRIRRRS
jgi:carbon storage regulator